MIEDYQLEEPSWEMGLIYLEEFMDPDSAQHLLVEICKELSIDHINEGDLTTLEIIFDHMSKRSGLVGVVGKSLAIRAKTYRLINKNQSNRNDA